MASSFPPGTNYNHQRAHASYDLRAEIGRGRALQGRCSRRDHDVTVAPGARVTYLGHGRRAEPGTWYCRRCSAVLLAPGQVPAAPLPVLTVKNPWAYAITRLGKRTENRGWRIPPGLLWLHAGARSGWDSSALSHPLLAATWHERLGPRFQLNPDADVIPFAAVVALIRVTGSHHSDECSRHGLLCDGWAARGQVHNEFDLVAALGEPVPARGNRGLWRLPPAIESACRAQLTGNRNRSASARTEGRADRDAR